MCLSVPVSDARARFSRRLRWLGIAGLVSAALQQRPAMLLVRRSHAPSVAKCSWRTRTPNVARQRVLRDCVLPESRGAAGVPAWTAARCSSRRTVSMSAAPSADRYTVRLPDVSATGAPSVLGAPPVNGRRRASTAPSSSERQVSVTVARAALRSASQLRSLRSLRSSWHGEPATVAPNGSRSGATSGSAPSVACTWSAASFHPASSSPGPVDAVP